MINVEKVKASLDEFLTCSSIDGLIHVSKAKTSWATFCWVLVIAIGFCMAGYLIQGSFISWSDSPFITTVNVEPITKAPFPIVTVCPPKGTNTALNYDIMAAQNVTLDNKTRADACMEAKHLILPLI